MVEITVSVNNKPYLLELPDSIDPEVAGEMVANTIRYGRD
jgi:hypothetical protein